MMMEMTMEKTMEEKGRLKEYWNAELKDHLNELIKRSIEVRRWLNEGGRLDYGMAADFDWQCRKFNWSIELKITRSRKAIRQEFETWKAKQRGPTLVPPPSAA